MCRLKLQYSRGQWVNAELLNGESMTTLWGISAARSRPAANLPLLWAEWSVDEMTIGLLVTLDEIPLQRHHALKRKCRHFDEILITGCTGSCHFDNFQCSQWWKFHQNEDISVSVHYHDGVIKWKHLRVTGPFKSQWRGALMFSLICAWINGWVSNREADNLRRHRAHYDVTVMMMEDEHCSLCNEYPIAIICRNNLVLHETTIQ